MTGGLGSVEENRPTANTLGYCLCRFRFIAVTRPIQYAKHRSTYRVPLTVAVTWVVSILISSPIVLGANYTEHRSDGTEVWP